MTIAYAQRLDTVSQIGWGAGWNTTDISSYAPANSVAEIICSNEEGAAATDLGVRPVGSVSVSTVPVARAEFGGGRAVRFFLFK